MKENKKQRIYRTIMLIIIVAVITFIVTSIVSYDGNPKYIISSHQNSELAQKLNSAIETITKILDEKYIGDVNEDELIEGALKGMVASVGDLYTEYYTKEELDDFTASTLGNFVGIGVYMQTDFQKDAVVVLSTIEGSPAEEAGLKQGDYIIKVDGVEYKAIEISELSNSIKGEEGTDVELTIDRNGEILNIKVTRRAVHINYVKSEKLEDDIGYISIETFDEGCKDDFVADYNKLVEQGIKSLIIDLRGNGGGLVDEALGIADLICDKNSVTLITIDKDGKEETTKSKTNPTIKMPVIILTDKGTASASEILAGALKDNEKAEIVGDTTYGKGVIQELIRLSNGGALKVTSAEYYTPKKNKINDVGIEPNYREIEENKQLEKAKEILKGKMK
ncbi:MAG: S41 family peptidase [Clostridia bacterium]|nr:S41 family peptidase [Clostridia bacterium]